MYPSVYTRRGLAMAQGCRNNQRGSVGLGRDILPPVRHSRLRLDPARLANLAKPAVYFICLLDPIIQPMITAVDTFGDALNRTLVDTFVGNIKQLVCVEEP